MLRPFQSSHLPRAEGCHARVHTSASGAADRGSLPCHSRLQSSSELLCVLTESAVECAVCVLTFSFCWVDDRNDYLFSDVRRFSVKVAGYD